MTEVASEAEAATICGFLEEQGIAATYDKGNVPGFVNTWSGPHVGRQEILVRPSDVERAREALSALEARDE